MYAQTKAATESSKEGNLFACFAKLQEGRKSPQTRSAADCCLRHLESFLSEQILAKGNKLGLYRNEAIYPWYELNESLKEESCRKYPKEYFQFFRYCPEQREFGLDVDAFDQATCPF